MSARQSQKLRVVLEFDVSLSMPGSDAEVPGPVARLIERVMSGATADQKARNVIASYAALLAIMDGSDLPKLLLGSDRLEDLLEGTFALLSADDQNWFRRVLEVDEARTECHRKWVAAGSPEDKSDGSEHLGDPAKVGWYGEVETPLMTYCHAEVVGIRPLTAADEPPRSL